MKRKAFLQTACTLTSVLLLAAACTQDELSGGKGETLPEGKYPMTFATTVEGVTVTRATTDNTWAGGEEVAVQVGTANPKKYTASTDGKLSAATNETPFYWESTSDIDVSAWYPYTATKPTTFIVKKDQSGTVQSGTDGYQASDLIYVASQKVTYSGSKALTFKHLPVKVTVHVKAGDGVTADEVEDATVTIVNQATESGAITEGTTSTDATTGGTNTADWSVAQVTSGDIDITPKVIICPADCQKSVQALLVPQQMKGVRFIKVTAGGNDYYYTPEKETDANLQAGQQYTYTITVTKNGLTVTASGAAEWTGTGTETEVEGKIPESGFSASDLKVGDYFYSDGTWSDGGYRKYTDDTKMILPIMPVLTNPTTNQLRTVIGIVYWVGDPTNTTNGDPLLKTNHSGCTHGLVVALHEAKLPLASAAAQMKWSNSYEQVNDWTNHNDRGGNKVNIAEQDKYQGYANTVALKAYNESCNVQNNSDLKVLPIAAIEQYSKDYPAPTNSSSWYVPSTMELKYMCWGQGNSQSTAGLQMLDTQIKKVSGTSSLQRNYYWSSSENTGNSYGAWSVDFNDGTVVFGSKSNNEFWVRALLAF